MTANTITSLNEIVSSLEKSGDRAVQVYLRALGKANKFVESNCQERKQLYIPKHSSFKKTLYESNKNRNASKQSENCDDVDDRLSRMQSQIVMQCENLFKDCMSHKSSNDDIRHHAVYHCNLSNNKPCDEHFLHKKGLSTCGSQSNSQTDSSYPSRTQSNKSSVRFKKYHSSRSSSSNKGHVKWQSDHKAQTEDGYESSSSSDSTHQSTRAPRVSNKMSFQNNLNPGDETTITYRAPSESDSLFLGDRNHNIPYMCHQDETESRVCNLNFTSDISDNQPVHQRDSSHSIKRQNCTDDNSQITSIYESTSKKSFPITTSFSSVVRKSSSEPALTQCSDDDCGSDSPKYRYSDRNRNPEYLRRDKSRGVVYQHVKPNIHQSRRYRGKIYTGNKTRHVSKSSKKGPPILYTESSQIGDRESKKQISFTEEVERHEDERRQKGDRGVRKISAVYVDKVSHGDKVPHKKYIDRESSIEAFPVRRKSETRPYTSINMPSALNWTKHVPKDPAKFSWKKEEDPPWENRSSNVTNNRCNYSQCAPRPCHKERNKKAEYVDEGCRPERSITYYSRPQKAVIIRGFNAPPPCPKTVKGKSGGCDPCAHLKPKSIYPCRQPRSRSVDRCSRQSHEKPCCATEEEQENMPYNSYWHQTYGRQCTTAKEMQESNPYNSFAMNSAYLNPRMNPNIKNDNCEMARPNYLMIYPKTPIWETINKYVTC